MAKPCMRCLVNPKIPGTGQRYCQDCNGYLSLTAQERNNARRRDYSEAKRRKLGKGVRPSRIAPAGTKWCPRCVSFLAVSNFSRGGKASYCKECQRDVYHETYVVRQYGITSEQYSRMLENQNGGCAICLRVLKTKRLCVDHNHKTGEVRGLLCGPCNNRILGSARDDATLLRRAADYLEDPPARKVLIDGLSDPTNRSDS